MTPSPVNDPASPVGGIQEGSPPLVNLHPLLNPASVSVVGASERPGSVGDLTLRQLISGGFSGPIYPVNPGYTELHGIASFPSSSDLPSPVDLTVLAVANHLLESEMEKAIASGTRAVTIFASCHGAASDGTPLRSRLKNLADAAGVPVCGGNGMGFLNVEDSVRVCGFYQPPLMPGGVAFISHSGSLFSAVLHNRRRMGFNLVVSSGLEINTTMDHYLDWVLDKASTRVVALFLETVRNPDRFRAALSKAEAVGVPVVALKVGTSPGAQAAVATHSEALAGETPTFDAVFAAHGVHKVLSPDELLDTVELFAAGRRATAAGLGAVHDSGGERALLFDTAHRVGVPLPTVAAETSSKLQQILDPGLEPANPVDAWGTGRNAEDVFAESLKALANDPSIGAVAFTVDLTPEEKPDDAYSSAALTVHAATEKPVMLIANLSSAVDPVQSDVLRSSGIPVLEGTETALRAVGHLFDHYRRAALGPNPPRLSRPRDVPSTDLDESESLELLEQYGVHTPRSQLVETVDGAVVAARTIGYPVVVKTAEFAHKSDVGGVVLNVKDEAGLRAVVTDIQIRLGDKVVVASYVPDGLEIALGMYTDAQFGPICTVGAGGTLVEILDDHSSFVPPIGPQAAHGLLDRLRLRPILDGVRGGAPLDIEGLVNIVVRFSELAADSDGRLASIDVNPIIVGPTSVVAVDALAKGCDD